MLKTLDILIGATTVLLLFSMAVTVITQAVTSLLDKRGKHLLAGLAGLLQQLGISTRNSAEQIAKAVLTHPALATVEGKLATVVHRGEFTKLLMDIAGGQQLATLEPVALSDLQKMLAANGVSNPAQTLSNIRKVALLIETSQPQIANHVREELAILQECATDYVAKINSWFDQTMDRVSQAFTKHAHRVTVVAAFVVVITVQLDIIAVVDRLSIDEQFRSAVVTPVAAQFSNEVAPPANSASAQPTPSTLASTTNAGAQGAAGNSTSNPTSTPAPANGNPASGTSAGPDDKAHLDTQLYYNLLNDAGLITLPTNSGWWGRFRDPRKYPGMILAALLISLGAPFWYNILKDLLGLRSALAQNDDLQRAQRQAGQPASAQDSGAASPPPGNPLPGEQGNLSAAG